MMDVLLFVMNEKISFVCIRGSNTQMSSRLKNQSILAPTKKVKKSRKKNERREQKREKKREQSGAFWSALLCVSTHHSRRRESFFQIKRVKNNIARSFSLLLFSLEQSERERE
jgi:hypothetical protein